MTTLTSIPASTSNYHQGRIGGTIRYIVVHDGETAETNTAAEGMGNWFANPAAQASAHRGTDADSICTYVQDEDTAWGAPYVNADGLHVEQAGRAAQSAADWSDAYSQATIANTAKVLAEWNAKHHIPLRTMTDAQLLSRAYAGVITHAQATRVFGPVGGHTDPGGAFPMADLVRYANALVAAPTTPVTPTPVVLPPVTKVPAKIWLKVDGIFGRSTRSRTQQLVHVPVDGIWGPVSVKAIQHWFGAPVDGVLGATTWQHIQSAVGAKPDGVPGAITITLLQRYLNGRP